MNEPITIEMSDLKPEILRGLIEEFISRDGTDYGTQEHTIDDKVAQVLHQLKTGRAVITFDSETESCNILSAE